MRRFLFPALCVLMVYLTACEDPNAPSGASKGKAVDLGLSVKWADRNIGATRPEVCGDYFAWGETKPKDDYSRKTHVYYDENGNITKYNQDSREGIVDNKMVLEPEDDAAHVNWGGKWRMPTDEEWQELCTKCVWAWSTVDNMPGFNVTGPNGNRIFLPAAGARIGTEGEGVGFLGHYWSSSLFLGWFEDGVIITSAYQPSAWQFEEGWDSRAERDMGYRSVGSSVRAVCP